MDPAGLVNKIFQAVVDIGLGRKGLATDGEEHNGRIHYENGIYTASSAFKEAQISADPQTLILVELAFLQQELQFCHETEFDTKSSLIQAIQSFEDALRSLEVVENTSLYRGAEKTWPTSSKYRIQAFPKDAFHLACIAHRTRLRNILRAPGINMRLKKLSWTGVSPICLSRRMDILRNRKIRSQIKKSVLNDFAAKPGLQSV